MCLVWCNRCDRLFEYQSIYIKCLCCILFLPASYIYTLSKLEGILKVTVTPLHKRVTCRFFETKKHAFELFVLPNRKGVVVPTPPKTCFSLINKTLEVFNKTKQKAFGVAKKQHWYLAGLFLVTPPKKKNLCQKHTYPNKTSNKNQHAFLPNVFSNPKKDQTGSLGVVFFPKPKTSKNPTNSGAFEVSR